MPDFKVIAGLASALDRTGTKFMKKGVLKADLKQAQSILAACLLECGDETGMKEFVEERLSAAQENRVAELQAQVAELQAQVAALKSAGSSMDGEVVDELKSRITYLEAQISSLNDRISQMQVSSGPMIPG